MNEALTVRRPGRQPVLTAEIVENCRARLVAGGTTIAALARIDLGGAHWRAAADALRVELERARRGGGELVLRWLSSYLTTASGAASREAIGADASTLVRALPLLG